MSWGRDLGRRRSAADTARARSPLDDRWDRRRAEVPRSGRDRRRQRARRRTVRRLRRTAPWLAAAAFAAGALGSDALLARAAAERPEIFALERLQVRGLERLSGAEVAAASRLAPGAPLTAVDPAALRERLVAHPWIAGARVSRVPPDAVLVEIRERRPVAVLESPGPARWVDAAGVAFAPFDGDPAGPWPRLLAATAPDPTRTDPALAGGVDLARDARALGLAVRAVELPAAAGADDALPALRLAEPPLRVVLGPGDWEPRLRRLVRVLAELPESRAAAEIDLRVAEQAILRPTGDPAGGEREGADARSRAAEPTSGRVRGAVSTTGG